jgi:hypothetical protein
MSKSYRKPYSAITGVRSAHYDKMIAARSVRRAQDGALRHAIANQTDWDEFLLPEVYECSDNDVWGWGRDGNQRLRGRSSQYNNPFKYVTSPTWRTEEDIMERWEENKQREDDWLKDLTRK